MNCDDNPKLGKDDAAACTVQRGVVRACAALVALLAVGFKVHKIALSPDLGAVARLFSAVPDVAFAAAQWLVWELALRAVRGRRSATAVAAAAQGWAVVVVALLSIEHGFYLKTGSLLDGFMLLYAWHNRADLWPVIRSELTAPTVAALVAGLLVALGPSLAGLGRRTRHWLRALGHRGRRAPMVAGALAAVASVVAFLAPATATTSGIFRPVAVGFALDVLQSSDAVSTSALAQVPAFEGRGRLVPAAKAPRRRNVVIVLLESVRARSTTPYNPELPTTPFLAELARKGRLVERAHAVVPHTSKALVATLCGVYPKLVTPNDETAPDGIPVRCLADLLREQGYATAYFQPAEEHYEGRAGVVDNFGYETFEGKESLARPGFDECSYFGYEDRIMLDPALHWVDEHRDQPFLLTILTLATHHDYKVPKGFPVEHYVDDDEVNRYLNIIRYTDGFLRDLYEGFEERGLLDDTVFVILGDHGEGFGEHGRRQHDNTIYEEGLHIPMILAGPGTGPPGEPIEGLRQEVDVVPTVLDVLGYRLEGGHLDGASLLEPSPHKALYASCWYRNYCMAAIEGNLKFIYHYHRRGMEVFDLARDPFERHNLLATGEVSAQRAEEVARALRSWREGVVAWYAAWDEQRKTRWITQHPTKPAVHADIVFGGIARLRGVDPPARRVRPGSVIEVRYHFEALRKPGPGWGLFVHVLDARNHMVLNADHVPVEGTYPIARWKPGQFIVDRQRIHLPAKLRPGVYRVVIGLWNRNIKDEVGGRAEPKGRGLRIDPDRRVEVARFRVTLR